MSKVLPALFSGLPFPVFKPFVLTAPAPRNTFCFPSLRACCVLFMAQVFFMLGILISLGRGGSLLTARPALLLENVAVSGCAGKTWALTLNKVSAFQLAQWGQLFILSHRKASTVSNVLA